MAGRDTYADRGSISAPPNRAFAVTPADSNLAHETRYVWVGGTGALSVIMAGDTVAVTFTGVPAGAWLPLQVKQIRATGTTATNIVGLY